MPTFLAWMETRSPWLMSCRAAVGPVNCKTSPPGAKGQKVIEPEVRGEHMGFVSLPVPPNAAEMVAPRRTRLMIDALPSKMPEMKRIRVPRLPLHQAMLIQNWGVRELVMPGPNTTKQLPRRVSPDRMKKGGGPKL
jgi:hypothetical protein